MKATHTPGPWHIETQHQEIKQDLEKAEQVDVKIDEAFKELSDVFKSILDLIKA